MGKSLTEIAQQLKDANKKVQLIYAFNGTGKTRLSREFKDLIAPKTDSEEDAQQSELANKNILYYSAFTEDLFYWDNDLELDAEPKLKIQPNSLGEGLRVIGIDPGKDTGMAEFEDGTLKSLRTLTPLSILCFLQEEYAKGISLVVLEDSRCQSNVFSASGEKNRSKALKIARDVGRIDALCSLIDAACKSAGIAIVAVSPLSKGAKLGGDDFKAVTSWEGRTNQHERDAAMVAWGFRKLSRIDGK